MSAPEVFPAEPRLLLRFHEDPRFHHLVTLLRTITDTAAEQSGLSVPDLLRAAETIEGIVAPPADELVQVALPGGQTGMVRRSLIITSADEVRRDHNLELRDRYAAYVKASTDAHQSPVSFEKWHASAAEGF